MTSGAPRQPSRRLLAKLAAGLVAAPTLVRAQDIARNDKPFASHHLVLQLSDGGADKQALVLSVAYNMLSVYGPDAIAIEVVAFAKGIDMLRAESVNRVRVDSLIEQGARFDACMNTVQTIERETGKPVTLNPRVRRVQAGVATILALVEHGYTLVRP